MNGAAVDLIQIGLFISDMNAPVPANIRHLGDDFRTHHANNTYYIRIDRTICQIISDVLVINTPPFLTPH